MPHVHLCETLIPTRWTQEQSRERRGGDADESLATPTRVPIIPRMGRRRILLVEDDLDLVDSVQAVLEGEDCSLAAVSDGNAALVAAGAGPMLVFVDLRIQGELTGAPLIAELRRRLPSGARLVLLSGEPNLPERARQCGADGYLEKPFDIEHLLRLIAAVPEMPEQDEQQPAP